MATIGFATLQVIPSLRGLEASMTQGLAPAQGIATAEGSKAGQAFGGRFGAEFKKFLPSAIGGLNVGPLIGGALIAGAVVGLAEVGGAVLKMRRIIEEESGATGATLNKLFDTAKREATKVPASFDDIAAAVSELQRRGVPLGAMFDKLAEQELFLAKITKTDLASNVDLTTGLFAKFNVPLKDQSRELDVLFKAMQASGKGLEPLVDSLQKGGAQLQIFGFDMDHSIALIAGLERAGVNVQPVLFALRGAFAKIAKEGGDPEKVLHGIFKELQSGKNPTLAMADAIKLFGARGGTELARAIQQGKLNVDALLKSITDGKGGILETGEAALTLADRFTLLKNQAVIALAPLATQIRIAFFDIVTQATPAITALFGAITNAASGLLPVFAPIAIAAEGLFKAALPVLRLFADDLNVIGDALHAIPAPILAGAGALAILALAALGAADGLIAAGRAAVASALEFAFTPVGAAVIAFSALVTAVSLFTNQSDGAKKEARDLGKAMFDASSDTTLFSDGISSANEAMTKFLDAQIRSGKTKGLNDFLSRSGRSVSDLASHMSLGQKEWDRYALATSKAASAGVNFKDSLIGESATVRNSVKALGEQRDAFIDNAKSQLETRVSLGELTNEQIHHLKETNKNADGSINWGKVLDATDAKLGSLAEQTQRTAQAAAESSPVYAALVDQFAVGAISADDFAKVLQDKFKFSADAAKSATKGLGEQVKKLGSEIESAFPPISDAAKGLKTNVLRVATDLAIRLAGFNQQLKQSAAEGAGATQQLKDSTSSNLKAIRADFKKLADDHDPERFTQNLLKQAANIAGFFSNLHTLVKEGFPQLARQLLALGVQGGANLAAGFAADKNKAKAGAAAAAIVNQAKNDARAKGLADFSAYQGIGALLPEGIKQGIDSGKPKVRTAATALHSTAHTGLGSLYGPGLAAGVELPAGVATGISSNRGRVRMAAGLVREGVHTGLGHLYDFGLTIGSQLDSGFAAGIIANQPFVEGTTARLVDGVKRIMGTGLIIKSPSKWARDFIGKNLVRGLAEGLDPRPLDTPMKHLVAHVQKGLSAPLVIGQAFLPPAPTIESVGDRRQATLLAPVVVPASFVPVQPVVFSFSGNNNYNFPDFKRQVFAMFDEWGRNNPHKPLGRS